MTTSRRYGHTRKKARPRWTCSNTKESPRSPRQSCPRSTDSNSAKRHLALHCCATATATVIFSFSVFAAEDAAAIRCGLPVEMGSMAKDVSPLQKLRAALLAAETSPRQLAEQAL